MLHVLVEVGKNTKIVVGKTSNINGYRIGTKAYNEYNQTGCSFTPATI